MRLEIPDFCMITLIGASGSGKSHFAAKHFTHTEVLESDYFRAMVCDDSSNQNASTDAFECLFNVAEKRLKNRKLTVIDATHSRKELRMRNLELCQKWHCLSYAIVFNVPEALCQRRNALRETRKVPERVVSRQCGEIYRSLKTIDSEGFSRIYVLDANSENIEIVRKPLRTDLREKSGPFDIIGDAHGCYAELCQLLSRMGYQVNSRACTAKAPKGRTAIFLGDLGDRGPDSISVFRLVMNMTRAGDALCVQGNHDVKLLRLLKGKHARMNPDLSRTWQSVRAEGAEFCASLRDFLQRLPAYYMLDGGRLAVAHAGLKEEYQGRASAKVRDFCLFGDLADHRDEFGLPIHLDWVSSYRGRTLVAYGHLPRLESLFVNNTICLDQGSAFGGSLAALRYPEMELCSVKALEEYCKPLHPLSRERA